MLPDIIYTHELPAHNVDIESLNAQAFGPARYTRAACFIRRGGAYEPSLSFVAIINKKIVGSVRMTRIAIGKVDALLLGPIVVSANYKNIGIGSNLMTRVLDAARKEGHGLVILVGDEPYYQRFGFRRIPSGKVIMPAPVNPDRLLSYELLEGSLQLANGLVRHINYVR